MIPRGAPVAMALGRDYEFDSYQPVFYDEDCEWDFYQSTALSEDIWKKFELLPTPPLSPNRANSMLLLPSGDLSLDGTSDFLDDETVTRSVLFDTGRYGGGRSCMKTVVLQDCMWSGFSARASLEKIVTEKLAAKKVGVLPSVSASLVSAVSLPVVSCVAPSLVAMMTPGGESCARPGEGGCAGVGDSGPCSDSLAVTSAVVDPAEMLPFGPGGQHLPSEGQSQGEVDDEEEEEEEDEEEETIDSGVVSTGNETPSDSDDDDDDEDDEEEEEDDEDDEEIDVVTVEKRGPLAKKSVPARTVYNTNTARQYNQQHRSVPAAFAARGHIPPVHQQHNYAAPSPPPCKVENAPPAKRFRPDVTVVPAAPAARGPTPSRAGSTSSGSSRANSTGCGSPRGSDCEDQDKRRTHNILERQRRNDLKNSFFLLRDRIPELAHNEKAAKVQILKKAIEYSRSLQRQEKKLEAEKRQQQIRHQELLKRLENLKNSKTKRS